MARPVVSPKRVEYGDQVTVSGAILGASGLAVTLQQQPFPFAAPFAAAPGTAAATSAQGAYRFTTRAFGRTRYGASAVGYAAPDDNNTAQVWVTASLETQVKRARHHRFVISGSYRPGVPSKATLYRLGHGRSGAAITPGSAGENSRTFRFAARELKPGRYEVRLVMPASAGIQSTHSEVIRSPAAESGGSPFRRGAYQAWPVPQCGQLTDVETDAWNWYPQEHP
jgi:hypothetical protein